MVNMSNGKLGEGVMLDVLARLRSAIPSDQTGHRIDLYTCK